MNPVSVFTKNNISVFGNLQSERTLIFAHGFGSDQSCWRWVLPGFLKDFKIVLYDNVGSTEQNAFYYDPDKYKSLEDYADDLIALCHELNIKQAIMVAHSVSGMITLLALEKDPELFSKAFFIGASPRYLNDKNYIGGFEREDLLALYKEMQSNFIHWVHGFAPVIIGNEDKPELAAEFSRTLSKIRPDIAVDVARVIFESDFRHRLTKLNIPVIIIQSHNDVTVPLEVGEYLLTHIYRSKLFIIDAKGHFPQLSAPREIINTIITNLN